jgi:hypothetical protein
MTGFIIKATSNVTGNIHYVKIDNDGCVGLEKDTNNATTFNSQEEATTAIKNYCEGEATQTYEAIKIN